MKPTRRVQQAAARRWKFAGGGGWVVLVFGIFAMPARAHEPYLLLTAKADQLAVEAGFSDRSSPEGLPLLVRDRASGQVLEQYTLPASGLLSIPLPKVAYRVVFEGGPGHRVSKPGPTSTAASAVVATPAEAPTTTASSAKPTAAEPAPSSPRRDDRIARDVRVGAVKTADGRVHAAAAVVLLFGAVSFGLGFWAGRPARGKASPSEPGRAP